MSARTRIALPVALALALFAATPAGAQEASLIPSHVTATAAVPEPAVAPAPVGPTMQSAAVAVRHQEQSDAAPAPRRGNTPGTALMIVGGAAVLVGLVVGGNAGNAIAVTGAVAGLIGLYQYLQ